MLALLLVLASLLVLAPYALARSAEDAVRLLGVRVVAVRSAEEGVQSAGLELEVSRAVSFDAGVQAGPLRLEVLVPGLSVAGKVRRSGKSALFGDIRWRRVSGGMLLSVALRQPALIVDAHAERATRGKAARLVVHVARTDRRTLARLLDVPEERLDMPRPRAGGDVVPARAARESSGTLEKIRQAYRRLIEQAVARPADIGDLIRALPREFDDDEERKGAAGDSSITRRDGTATWSDGDEADGRGGAGGRTVIVLDAGHGGRDPGAIGPRGVKEKVIVLKFARALGEALRRRGYRVVMTRTDDTYLRLRERVEVARRHHAALFISIHADKFRKRGVGGLGIYTLSEEASDEDAAELARMENAADLIGAPEEELEDDKVRDILVELTQRETNANSHLLAQRLVRALRGVVRLRRNPVRSAAFRVLRAPEIPSLLVELGYITNPRDVRNMLSPAWRRKAVARMAAAIDKVLKERLALR